MGSYNEARMTGFMCKLCWELNTHVIHIYSDKGKDIKLAEKLTMMGISLEPEDNLPQTICGVCITKLDAHYQFMQNVRENLVTNLLQISLARQQQQSNSTATEETQNSEDVTENCAVRSPNSNSK